MEMEQKVERVVKVVVATMEMVLLEGKEVERRPN